MISKKQKILRLENELRSKNKEIAELRYQLNEKENHEQGVCKSEFCEVCKHFIKEFGGCSKHEKAPCKDFVFAKNNDVNVQSVVKVDGKTIYRAIK